MVYATCKKPELLSLMLTEHTSQTWALGVSGGGNHNKSALSYTSRPTSTVSFLSTSCSYHYSGNDRGNLNHLITYTLKPKALVLSINTLAHFSKAYA